MGDDADALAIGIITACHAGNYAVMAEMINDMAFGNVGGVIASMAGLASSMVDHLCTYMEVEPAALLHMLGIETALG